ncbi:MAG TPA: hypothetical protein DCX32_01735 [Candidatus Moranbacteria bacterium]|nr:MAG: hypothetical protein UW95_C0020G0005 [Parcubacteria group bacterium GW2011_GWC1_45_14]HAV11243.1 hypothetical protein [Candidatus Moranbacteria bacterium]
MKKILLVTRPITPPWDEASKNFAYFLAKSTGGFEFNVLTPGHVDSLEKHIVQQPIYTSAHLDWGQRLRIFKLAKLVRGFDIAHFMLTPTKLNTLAFKIVLGKSKAKTVQTIATLREDLFSDKELKKVMFADLVITYSDYAKHKLESLGVGNVKRIYPGIDLDLYKPSPKDDAVLRFFNIDEKDFVISYPGEYTRLGATDGLVEILPKLFKKIPNAKFVFACRVKNEKDAQKKAEITERFKKENILDKIVFTDTFADMPKIYNMSDVVVFPVKDMKGKFDVPLAVIEAFACEKPVVISDIPILGEFANADNSVIISHKDFDQLVDSLTGLHADLEMGKALGKAARKYTQDNFDIKNVSEEYKKAYESLL